MIRTFLRKACETQNEEEKWRFIAWSIAWEGTISLMKHVKFLIPKVNIRNTEKEMLEKLLSIVKVGRIESIKQTGKNNKPQWQWITSSEKACNVLLKEIRDYIPSERKKRLADLLIEFCELRIFRNRHKAPYSLREWEIYEEVKKLNKRGLR